MLHTLIFFLFALNTNFQQKRQKMPIFNIKKGEKLREVKCSFFILLMINVKVCKDQELKQSKTQLQPSNPNRGSNLNYK